MLTEDLEVYYPMNNTNQDLSKNQYHAITNNLDSSNDRFGDNNSAYIYKDNQSIFKPPDNILNNINEFTIMFWFKYNENLIINDIINQYFLSMSK